MKELIGFLAKAVVYEPEAVKIEADKENGGLIFTVSVAPDDMGRIIGKKGRIISAIRTVVRAAAGETDVNIEVLEIPEV